MERWNRNDKQGHNYRRIDLIRKTALKMYFFLILSLIGRVSFVDIVSVEEKLSGRVHWENMRLAGCRCNVT